MKNKDKDRGDYFKHIWHEFKHDIFDILNRKEEKKNDDDQLKDNPLLLAFKKPPLAGKRDPIFNKNDRKFADDIHILAENKQILIDSYKKGRKIINNRSQSVKNGNKQHFDLNQVS